MKIQINTDNNVEGSEALSAQAEAVVKGALDRFVAQITRIEVHISDEDSGKGSHDTKRCMMEARIEDRQPCAVTAQGATLEEAIDGAADKLRNLIEHTVGRLQAR